MKSILFVTMFFIAGIVLFWLANDIVTHYSMAQNNSAGQASLGYCIAGGMAIIASAIASRNRTPRE